jgi:prepilin-type N-terminal cleavage/methylation domain-containing protein/prepilin-type processing-associated H-X9-DG protein
MKKSAFTLIELLVVIAIIAILASIAVPVFNKAMERSKATNCAANLRQLGIGMVAYLNDNEDQMFKKDSSGEADSPTWPVILQTKYVSNWKVFRSPFDRVTGARPDRVELPGVPVSYGINDNLFDVNAGKFVAPSQLIMMAPALIPAPEIAFLGNSDTNVSLPTPEDAGSGKLGTHTNRSQINVLYADTHAVSIPYREFASAQDEAGLKRWMPTGKAKEEEEAAP